MHGFPAWPFKDVITLSASILGATLGIMNTWNSLNQRRVKLRVKPSFAYPVGGGPDMFSIEVVNLSAFPVIIHEVGFSLYGNSALKGERASIFRPILIDGGGWPRKLEPRTTVSGYFDYRQLRKSAVYKAYAMTACGEVRYGKSPALRKLREIMMA